MVIHVYWCQVTWVRRLLWVAWLIAQENGFFIFHPPLPTSAQVVFLIFLSPGNWHVCPKRTHTWEKPQRVSHIIMTSNRHKLWHCLCKLDVSQINIHLENPKPQTGPREMKRLLCKPVNHRMAAISNATAVTAKFYFGYTIWLPKPSLRSETLFTAKQMAKL